VTHRENFGNCGSADGLPVTRCYQHLTLGVPGGRIGHGRAEGLRPRARGVQGGKVPENLPEPNHVATSDHEHQQPLQSASSRPTTPRIPQTSDHEHQQPLQCRRCNSSCPNGQQPGLRAVASSRPGRDLPCHGTARLSRRKDQRPGGMRHLRAVARADGDNSPLACLESKNATGAPLSTRPPR
jgi:hypothetical protein